MERRKCILVIEDELVVQQSLVENLTTNGFDAYAYDSAEKFLNSEIIDCADAIIMDIRLPGINGWEATALIKKRYATMPVIMLTAYSEVNDRLQGFEIGADDYMTKPFRPRELVARVRAVLRRSGESQPVAKVLKAADVVLDRDSRTVRVAEQFMDLTPSEFDILTALMTKPGRVYSRLDLLDIIQGVRYEGYERTIDTHIKNLRGKIEPDPRAPQYIETVYGVGYRFKRA